MAATEEDEWEFEYDENDTEDFYITVDLSGVPEKQDTSIASQPLQPMHTGTPVISHNRLRVLHTVTGDEDATLEQPTDTQDEGAFGQMQISGLHTRNPLMIYNGQLISCEWASTIGTDLFFVKPAQNTLSYAQPLRSLPSVDLLGIGSAKLMAKAARLEPRDDVFQNNHESVDVVGSNGFSVSGNGNDPTKEVQTNLSGIIEAETTRAPSAFLARLNEAKAKRGDKTRLVIGTSANGSRLSAENVSNSSESTGALP